MTLTRAPARREKLDHLRAVCLVRPTKENLALLRRELRAPKYKEYHLFFTNTASDIVLQELAEADVQERTASVQVSPGQLLLTLTQSPGPGSGSPRLRPRPGVPLLLAGAIRGLPGAGRRPVRGPGGEELSVPRAAHLAARGCPGRRGPKYCCPCGRGPLYEEEAPGAIPGQLG